MEISIGVREVYDAVNRVEAKVDTFSTRAEVHEWRLNQLEARDKDKRTQLLAWLALGAAALAAILPVVVR